MAGVSGGELALAISSAGGFGFIGAGYMTSEELLIEADLAGDARHGIGFITWRLHHDEAALETILARKPEAIFLSFGDASRFAPRIRRSGAILFMQVHSLGGAKEAARLGADVIVLQGAEAGGHGATRALGPLVDEVINANLGPVILAAGGISNGKSLAAALVRGVSGAVLGTAFYAAEESLAHLDAKRRAVSASGDDTERSDLFDVARGLSWPNGWTLRTAKNAFTRRWHNGKNFAGAGPAEKARFAHAARTGDHDIAPIIVGEGVGLAERIEPAANILSKISLGAESALRSAPLLLR